jgi:putative copper export protein
MFLLIPFLVGAGTTGYVWYNSKEEEKETTFQDELFNILKPIFLILVVVLFLRWLYLKGSEQTPK